MVRAAIMAIFKGPRKPGILSGPEKERGIFGDPKRQKPKRKPRPPTAKKKKKRGVEA